MTKSDLVNVVAEKTDFTKKDTETVISAFLDAISNGLSMGEKIQLTGFGTFEVRERAARKGVNPRTKEIMDIASSKVPAFKAGTTLKGIVSK